MLRTVLLIVLVLILLGAFPAWPWASGWNLGYWPSGGALVLIILLLLLL